MIKMGFRRMMVLINVRYLAIANQVQTKEQFHAVASLISFTSATTTSIEI